MLQSPKEEEIRRVKISLRVNQRIPIPIQTTLRKERQSRRIRRVEKVNALLSCIDARLFEERELPHYFL